MPSMLAFPMAFSQYENGAMDIAMSVTSRYLPYEVASLQHKSFPGGEAMFLKYNSIYQLRAVHFGEDLRASENMEYMSQVSLAFLTRIVHTQSTSACALTPLPLFLCAQGSTNNSLCFLGPHRKYDGLSKAYTQLVPGMGHWGPDARPGDVRFPVRTDEPAVRTLLQCRRTLTVFHVVVCLRRPAGAVARPST
jgi:hypothetical protein